MDIIKQGEMAPDFTLEDHNGNEIKLSDLKGKKVLLSFHPLAWTGVCIDQMRSLEREFDRIKEKGVSEVLGVSVDAQPGKAAWAKTLGIENIKLVADFEPKGEMAKVYGLYSEELGASERANVLIDEDGKVIWSKKYELTQLPDIDEVIENL